MAEKFEDVVNKLGKATKKASLSKAPIVVAVQLVDDKGMVIKEDSRAAATEDKREEDANHAADNFDAMQSLNDAFSESFPSQLENSLVSSGMISESTPGEQTNLLKEIRAGVDGMKESWLQKFSRFAKGFNVFQLGFGASNRGRRKEARESAHMEALMQADIKDLSNYFNKGHGLSRALTEHQNKGFLAKMLGKRGLKQQEKEDEASYARQKQTGLLMSIAENTGGINEAFMKKDDDKKKKGGLFGKGLLASLIPLSMMTLLPGILKGSLSALGIGAVIAGGIYAAVKAVGNGLSAWAEVEEGKWGTVDKVSGFIGGLFGGKKEGGLMNALNKAWQGGAVGATAGFLIGGPVGMIIGALIGTAVGGILGWIGGAQIADWIDNTVKDARSLFDMPELLSPEQKAAYAAAEEKLETEVTALDQKIVEYKEIIAADSSTVQEKIDAEISLIAAEKERRTLLDTLATNRRIVAESALAEHDQLLAINQNNLNQARQEKLIAQTRFNNAQNKLWWVSLLHGTESSQYAEAQKEYVEAESALSDRKDHVIRLKEQRDKMNEDRSALRTEIDKEHQSFRGDARLFWLGEMEWQKKLLPEWMLSPIYKDGESPLWKDHIKPFTDSIPQWIKDNIFDPGSSRAGLRAGSPMKIFGMEIKFPSLNISFSGMADKIMALLPRWLTDPVGYIKGLVDETLDILPKPRTRGRLADGSMGREKNVSEMSQAEIGREIAKIKEKMGEVDADIIEKQDFLAKDRAKARILKIPEQIENMKARQEERQARMTLLYESGLKRLGVDPIDFPLAERQTGGPVTKGTPYIVGENTLQGELFVPSESGAIINAQRTQQIMEAGLRRSDASTAAPTIVNAPSNTVVDNKQSNTTNTTVSFSHPSPILNAVNVAA